MEKHIFASSITGNGFVQFYENIIDRKNCNRFYVLKGGSGTGKSTLLKRIAKYFLDQGSDIEYYHCSADTNSIDGIVIKDKNVAMVDGTAPHVVDVKYVNSTDFMIDLSKYIDKEKMKNNKNELVKLMNYKKFVYEQAYQLISVLSKLVEQNYKLYCSMMDFEKLNNACNIIANCYEKKLPNKYTKNMFSGAITSEGETYLESEINQKIIKILGDKILASIFLDTLYEVLNFKNQNIQCFYSPYTTKHIYDLLLNDEVYFVTNEKIKSETIEEEIDVNSFLIKNEKAIKAIDKNKKLIKCGISDIKKYLIDARQYHSEIEELYIPNVNFCRIDELTDKIILEIDKF